MDVKEIKLQIIKAGEKAVMQLIKVAEEHIIKYGEDDELAADKLKNAAATKKLAIFDAFEILQRIQEEEDKLNDKPKEEKEEKAFKGFAERRSK
jgi:ASC-1-like (ASCH) protein